MLRRDTPQEWKPRQAGDLDRFDIPLPSNTGLNAKTPRPPRWEVEKKKRCERREAEEDEAGGKKTRNE
jgi:hypothetical protein